MPRYSDYFDELENDALRFGELAPVNMSNLDAMLEQDARRFKIDNSIKSGTG